MKEELINIDNEAFRQVCFGFVKGLLYTLKPKDFFCIMIDNWFDSKWCTFSGKVLGALGVWKPEITIPPFNPSRVTSEGHFYITSSKDNQILNVKDSKIDKKIHIWQPSSDNLRRKITKFTDDGIFFWLSKNTSNNDIGCMMVYLIKDNETWAFYISLEKNKDDEDDWQFRNLVGITRDEALYFLDKGKTIKLEFD